MHYARLAETEARDAQYRAIARNARLSVEAGTKRRAELEVAVRDAEIKALAARAQSDSERARLESEARARVERERMEAASRAREAEQQAADERVRALQAQLDAERQKTAEQQQQAQMESLRAQIEEQKKAADAARRAAEEQVAAARKTAEAERARADQARREAERVAAREKTQGDLLARLQAIEQSARVEARGIVLTLPGSVYFDTGRADVKKGAAERVARIGEALAGAQERKLIVEGHTDSTGSTATNEKLSAPQGGGRQGDPRRPRRLARPHRDARLRGHEARRRPTRRPRAAARTAAWSSSSRVPRADRPAAVPGRSARRAARLRP